MPEPAELETDPQVIDYDALAKKAGATGSTPPPQSTPAVDYDALAKKAGATGQTAPSNSNPTDQDHPGAVSRFFSSLAKNALPSTTPSDYLSGPATAIMHPSLLMDSLGHMVKGALSAQGEQGKKALDAIKKGDIAGSIQHGLGYVLPVIGPQLSNAGDQMKEGDIAGGLGSTVGAALPIVAPEMIKNVGRSIPKKVNIPALATNPNPAEAAAVEFAQERGVPVDAGLATGNKYVQGAQALADKTTLPGAVISGRARAAQAAGMEKLGGELAGEAHAEPQVPESAGEATHAAVRQAAETEARALAQEGQDIAAQVHPEPQSPETAGKAVSGSLTNRISALRNSADSAYDAFRELEQDPKNLKDVQTGTKITTKQVPTGEEDSFGMPTYGEQEIRTPIAEKMAIPTDVRGIKADLAPMLQDMEKWMEPARRNASAGYQAIKSIVNGPDFIPASQAEKGLGGLKALAREAPSEDLANVSQGIGKNLAGRLQKQIDAAVQHTAGPEALKALQEGRASHAQKMEVADVLDSLRKEPVQAFNQSTMAGDAGIEKLREIAQAAPGEIPRIGRAWLDHQMASASQVPGRFDGEMFTDAWHKLGPETQKILFGKNARAIENFANRSATGGVAQVFDRLKAEPVQVFKQATMANDAGIDQLRSIARIAPEEMPKIGRAFLDELLSKATAEGGFQRGASLFSDWKRLGPQTKALLFDRPGLVDSLDKFFLVAKRLADNPNPSGTATLGTQAAGGLLMGTNPLLGTLQQIGGGSLSALFRNPTVIKLLTKGLEIPLRPGEMARLETAAKAAAVDSGVRPAAGVRAPAQPPAPQPAIAPPAAPEVPPAQPLGQLPPPSPRAPTQGNPNAPASPILPPEVPNAPQAPVQAPAQVRPAAAGAAGPSPSQGQTLGQLPAPLDTAPQPGPQSRNVATGQSANLPRAAGEVQQVRGANGADQSRTAGVETTISVPGETAEYPARYTVRELDSLQPSHSGLNFQSNKKYGAGGLDLKNDRNYSNSVNQDKVLTNAQPGKFNPNYLVTDNPDATNGPPIVDEQGNALGGNGRLMILQRVHAYNPEGSAAYREALTAKAEQFGVDPEAIAGMKKPVLVREVPSEHWDSGSRAKAVTDFNKKGTADLTPSERAIADSRRVSQETLDHVATQLEAAGPKATMADALDKGKGIEVLQRLIDDGVISPQERASLANESGLTKDGRSRVSSLLIGRFFQDAAHIDNVSPAVRAKVERIAAPLAKTEGLEGEWNLVPHVQDAMKILEEMRGKGSKNVDEFIRQEGLFAKQSYSPQSLALAEGLSKAKTADVVTAARRYAEDASFASHPSMFGNTPTPESAFSDTFGKLGKPAAKSATTTPRETLGQLGN
ncbi:MAG TPA: hypothetical protein VNH83_28180 [Bryobacteraceae bacterium]|nr:hypothetical protein [Bryobacteraceae bacterium]